MNFAEKERARFEQWIKIDWNAKYHNFSLKENGEYYFDAMEDAWGIWLLAKIDATQNASKVSDEELKKLKEINSWFANQRGMICRDYAKDLAKIIIRLEKND